MKLMMENEDNNVTIKNWKNIEKNKKYQTLEKTQNMNNIKI